jgi:DNA-binding transcriptional LysR family regulator
MDRIEAMTAFVGAVDEGSLAGASRRLGRSPAAVTRAIAGLERLYGTRLLHRTTRAIRLTEAGERYAASCRRILADLQEAELVAAGERAAPRGVLTVTAPLFFGRLFVRPLIDAYLDTYSSVQARLLLVDRVVSLIDEGVDAAIRFGHLPESGLIAVKTGEVRRVTCASPAYLRRRKQPHVPADLVDHDCIVFTSDTPTNVWSFAPHPGSDSLKPVRVRSRLTVTEAEAAIGSAVAGHGVTCVLSYQVEREIKRGRLKLILERYEPRPVPVNIVYPEARLSAAKTRAFLDFATPRLKKELARISAQIASA